jgi:hypothetical protein
VGSGGRYAFEVDELPALKTRFDAWFSEREAAAKARAEAWWQSSPAVPVGTNTASAGIGDRTASSCPSHRAPVLG